MIREVSVSKRANSSSVQTRVKAPEPSHQKSGTSQDTSSPPATRLCRISTPLLASKSSSSNVPSWMKQTISRILATTGPPYSKKQMSQQEAS